MKALASIMTSITTLSIFMGNALAAQPHDAGLWHQEAATKKMEDIVWFDIYTFWFITPITIFVMLLLMWVMVRYNAKANPVPSKNSHNTTIEVIWTVAPIAILIAIALPSFELLDSQFEPGEEPGLTIKATGQQWYWDYEYQDGSEIEFSSNMLEEDDRGDAGKTDVAAYPRLLAVDNEVVVPVNTMIRVLVTAEAEGVIHNLAMPAFGLKMDAIPGRINETWFKAKKEGMYYGQCSELCGIRHAFMPIAINVVSQEKYDAWRQAAIDAGDVEDANEQLRASIEAEKSIKLADNN